MSTTKDSGTSSALFTVAAVGQSSNVTKVTTTADFDLSGEGLYHMDMEGGLSNGMHFSKRFSMFVTDTWIPLSLDPVLVNR